MNINGNVTGVKDTFINKLKDLYDIEISQGEIISEEVTETIADISKAINREISVYINRRGKIINISIGDYSKVDLPSIDYRRGTRRLSGIRCIHTHPNGSGKLSSVDISALIMLRLDLIVGIGLKENIINDIFVGYLSPESGIINDNYILDGPYNINNLNKSGILDRIKDIEKEVDSNIPIANMEEREKVLLVGLELPNKQGSSNDLLNELEELAKTAGAEVIGKVLQKRNIVDTAYYIGSGKASELNLLRQSYNIDTIIFDDELSGVQVRNLEEATGAKVIDRTTLILDIFAQRAQTSEGKLQVELAQLKYRSARLIGLGHVLSRTGGGIGTRGPGEKKLEIDRRRIKEKVNELEDELENVRKNRKIQREKRQLSSIPVISLVGYTNAGKSTLRNKLSDMYQTGGTTVKDRVLEADMLFATLDPTTRIIKLPNGREVLISDTVGFIRKLPHELIDAFRATLEEVVFSDVLIHVVDSSSESAVEQIKAVNDVLKQIEAGDKPVIMALNKIDRVADKDSVDLIAKLFPNAVEISAKEGTGIDLLVREIEKELYSKFSVIKFKLLYSEMGLKSKIYKDCRVISEDYLEECMILTAEVDNIIMNKYKNYITE